MLHKNSKTLGYKGEKIAQHYLEKKSYKILHTNWIYAHKEVDIIAIKDDFIIFVEVKTRKNCLATDDLLHIITKQKMRYLLEAAQAYINRYSIEEEVRFDILLISIEQNENKINHIEDAFNNII